MEEATIKAATADTGVKVWEKQVYETPNQTFANPTDIGWLRNNDGRLNVVSNLTSYDKQQVYRIATLTKGDMAFGMQSDVDQGEMEGEKKSGIRIQFYDVYKRLIADSASGKGKASEAFEAMHSSTYSMKKGNYYMVVSRAEGVDLKADVKYAIQTRLGDLYKHDYVTTQAPLTDEKRRAWMADPMRHLPPGVTSYNSAGVLLNDALSNSSSLFGGVSFGPDPRGPFGVNKLI